jgi:hypothetical protein
MKIIITTLLLVSINIIDCLNSKEICYKRYKCVGNHCKLLNCTGSINNYDCERYECSLNAKACDEFQSLENELFYRKSSKLDRAFTVSLMQGISFPSKRLKRYEKMRKQFTLCPV